MYLDMLCGGGLLKGTVEQGEAEKHTASSRLRDENACLKRSSQIAQELCEQALKQSLVHLQDSSVPLLPGQVSLPRCCTVKERVTESVGLSRGHGQKWYVGDEGRWGQKGGPNRGGTIGGRKAGGGERRE